MTHGEQVPDQATAPFTGARADIKSGLSKVFHQASALSVKSALTLWRRPAWVILYVATPLLTAIALAAVSHAAAASVFPPDGGVDLVFQRCHAFNAYGRVDGSKSCVSIAYAPSSSADASAIMGRLSRAHGLTHGSGMSHDVVPFESAEELALALLKHPGKIDAGIVFTNITSYELWYNRTALNAYRKLRIDRFASYFKIAGRNLALQQAVDAAIIGHAAGSIEAADLKLTFDTFPQKLSTPFLVMIGELGVVPWLGATLLTVGFVSQFLLLAGLMGEEKQSGVLGTMRQMGMAEGAHWGSWLANGLVLNLVSAGLVAAVAPTFGSFLNCLGIAATLCKNILFFLPPVRLRCRRQLVFENRCLGSPCCVLPASAHCAMQGSRRAR